MKSSGRSAEEELSEMSSARNDISENEKPPSQMQERQLQRFTPDDMRPKPPRSAPIQNSFARYNLKASLDLTNRIPNSARQNDKEQPNSAGLTMNSARPISAKEYRLRKTDPPLLVVKPASTRNRLPKLGASLKL